LSATVLAVGIYISGEAIKPVVRPVGNLLTNGDFSQGLEGWIIEEHGYYGPGILHPYSFGTHLPTTSKGYLDLGVYGGYIGALKGAGDQWATWFLVSK